MKRFEKDASGDKRGKRRPPTSFRGDGFRPGGGDRRGPPGRFAQGDGEQGAGRYDARPRRFEGGAKERPYNTYRREDGPREGYGRSNYGSYGNRYSSNGQSSRPQERRQAPEQRPEPKATPVALEALKRGVREANRALAGVVEQFGHSIEGGYDISELEVTVAFAADGRFLGFGEGGAATMKLSLTPLDGEALFEADQGGAMHAANELTTADGLDEAEFELDDEDDEDDDVALAGGLAVDAVGDDETVEANDEPAKAEAFAASASPKKAKKKAPARARAKSASAKKAERVETFDA